MQADDSYHPSADALGSIILDLPFKIVNVTCMNLILYFITNLRREPGPFFFFLFVSFLIFQTMSFLYVRVMTRLKPASA